MLSPYKLYKYDKGVARAPVTWGMYGKPAAGTKGTLCYRNQAVDWSIHRLAPGFVEGGKPGSLRQRAAGNAAAYYGKRVGGSGEVVKELKNDTSWRLLATSPRWGQQIAPGLKGKEFVPLPDKEDVQVSKSTKALAGTTAVGGAVGYSAKTHNKFYESVHQYAHPKYKSKVKKGSYTQYKY